MTMQAQLYTDGGSRGNPGPAASGAVLFDMEKAVIDEVSQYLGTATNNVAEYTAIIIGLQLAQAHKVTDLSVYMDSELAVKQLNGKYKVKNAQLAKLWVQVRELAQTFERVTFSHVRREQNTESDALVNKVLDEIAA